ncbi:hypothetical protein E0Z10_g6422 [Xylaria hypoxylon]|uniref:Uncharacterized protein n=1 Tax=Xylaria hypoxylon TaxID=37992 RepID=A0A4Z0YY76_9PEZI|nr:hypothetical protein E0Z10_g6422 [Xylaria hypoxylon]
MFKYWWLLAQLVIIQAIGSHAKLNCPLYGLSYPKPSNLANHPDILKAASALDSVIGQYIDNANNTGSDKFSYSVEVFTANEQTPLWTHYWTAKNLATMDTTGVKTVDGKTVYRIGSLTKVFTMLTFLAEVGDSVWNDPIARYIPEIAAMVVPGRDNSHSLTSPDWGSITIGALASQISGLMRDYSLLGELTQSSNMSETMALGLPALSVFDIPPCGNSPVCNRPQFFKGLRKIPPSFSPFVTPAYSDVGYVLLGYALERMTGKPFQRSFEDKVVKALNLSHTFYSAPKDSLGVIPGDRQLTTWAFNMGNESPKHLFVLFGYGDGRKGHPEINPTAMAHSTYQFATTFNKLGSIGKYSTLLAVIPDFDIGFSVAAAGEIPAALVTSIADTLSNTYLPTLQEIARSQANATYAGFYRSVDKALNSSLTISVDENHPGLGVGGWISNGTNLMALVVALSLNISREYWADIESSVRLYPSGLWDATANGGRRVGFKATFEDLSSPSVANPYTTDCATWVSVSSVAYGSQPLDEFIFDVDASGTVLAVENAALRNRLVKVS